ncbi:7TM chemoreceptor [Cinara cedri]|uniref:Gustatory receptor n=1 Tax=Cinara cedri TaxID=506608 RepID=A0A5E4NA61_9HEMI|nr:7TM chemoreceptor [Cinara cedri]
MFELFWPAKCCDDLGVLFSVWLVASCVYSFARASKIKCILEKCDDLMSILTVPMFPRTVACMCAVAVIAYTCQRASNRFAEYEERIERYAVCFPMGVRKANARRVYTALVAAVYATVTVPANAYRIYLFCKLHEGWELIAFYVLLYGQNFVTCLSELRFLLYCFELFQHFQLINEEISAIKSKTIVANKYPLVLRSDEYRRAGNNVIGSATATKDDRGVPHRLKQYLLSKNIETLKVRHQFVSDAVRDLNELYDVQLGVTLFGLFLMTLFDIFDAISAAANDSAPPNRTKNSFLVHSWLTQYSFRFCVIVLTAHFTVKQASNSKTLITDVNHRFMDTHTKEELRLFLNELNTRSVQFTTFDFFNLNARLITSAIVAGTTYLVILLQFRI